MCREHVVQANAAARGCRGTHKGGRGNSIGNHTVLTAGKLLHTFHHYCASARAAHTRTAVVQEGGEITDFRLTCGICDHRSPLRRGGCQKDVLRGADAGKRKADRRAAQRPLHGAGKAAVILRYFRTHAAQRPQMQINGARPQLAAAGKREHSPSRAGKDGTQKDDGRPHFAHKAIRNVTLRHGGRINHKASALPVHGAAQMAQNARRDIHVGEVRAIM